MGTEIKDKLAPIYRTKWAKFYNDKYYNLWLNRFEIKGVTPQQELYIKKRFWTGQTLGCFSAIDLGKSFLGGLPPKAQKLLTEGNASIGFAPFAITNYSGYDYPATGLLINERGTPYIPQGKMIVGKNVVITLGLYSGASFGEMVKTLVKSIVDCEMRMRKNMLLSTGTAGLEVGLECPTRAEELAKKIMSDDAVCAVEGSETTQIHPFNGGQMYNVDKIRIEKEAREAELKCLLGLDSVATEKKERLITSEADSKKTECTLSKDMFMNPLRQWFSEIEEVLGYHLALIDPYEEVEKPLQTKEEEEKQNAESEIQ